MKGKFHEAEAANITFQILSALQFCHKKDIIHLDLKPDNILYCDTDQTKVKLIDFGVSALFREKCIASSVHYASPEMKGFRYITQASADIWSLGCIVFEMLFGKRMINEDHLKIKEISEKKRGDLYLKLDALKQGNETEIGCSKEALDFIDCATKIDIRKRHSAEELLKHEWIIKGLSSSKTNESHCINLSFGYGEGVHKDSSSNDICNSSVIIKESIDCSLNKLNVTFTKKCKESSGYLSIKSDAEHLKKNSINANIHKHHSSNNNSIQFLGSNYSQPCQLNYQSFSTNSKKKKKFISRHSLEKITLSEKNHEKNENSKFPSSNMLKTAFAVEEDKSNIRNILHPIKSTKKSQEISSILKELYSNGNFKIKLKSNAKLRESICSSSGIVNTQATSRIQKSNLVSNFKNNANISGGPKMKYREHRSHSFKNSNKDMESSKRLRLEGENSSKDRLVTININNINNINTNINIQFSKEKNKHKETEFNTTRMRSSEIVTDRAYAQVPEYNLYQASSEKLPAMNNKLYDIICNNPINKMKFSKKTVNLLSSNNLVEINKELDFVNSGVEKKSKSPLSSIHKKKSFKQILYKPIQLSSSVNKDYYQRMNTSTNEANQTSFGGTSSSFMKSSYQITKSSNLNSKNLITKLNTKNMTVQDKKKMRKQVVSQLIDKDLKQDSHCRLTTYI